MAMFYPVNTASALLWHPGDKGPDTDRRVLCVTLTKKGVLNYYLGYYTEQTGWVCGMNSNVVAWMELPAPPEVK